MSTDHIRTELEHRILTIRMNRPDKKNALSAAMYEAMATAIRRAEEDAEVRVLLFAGSGDCFTSGNDILDFLQNPPEGQDSPVARFMQAVTAMQKPAVAAVNGIAIGIGVTLLLHCDLVFAGRGARMQMPFVNIGTCPELASSYLLPRMMGHQRAAQLLMLGEAFDPELARELGLVNRVCPPDQTEALAREAGRRLAAQPPAALRACKALLKRAPAATLAETMRIEAEQFFAMLRGPEAREALSAFAQKRVPDFSHFA